MRAVSSIENILRESRLVKARKLTTEDYASEGGKGILSEYFSLSDEPYLTDIGFEGGLRVGEKHCSYQTISHLSAFPAEVHPSRTPAGSEVPFSFAYPLGLGLKCNHVYNQYIFLENQEEMILEREQTRIRQGAFSKISPANENHSLRLKELITKAAEKRLVRFHGNVLLWAPSRESLSIPILQTHNAFQRMGFIPHEGTMDAASLFWAGCPGNASDVPSDLRATLFAEEALTLLNWETHYRSSPSDWGLKFTDRTFGIPIQVDLTEEPRKLGIINNPHKFIIGPSGSGKSFFMNTLMASNFTQGMHCFIIDIGYSYKRTCELFGGRYIDWTEENPLEFNPFWVESPKRVGEEKIESLMNVLFTLWLKREASKAEESILREILLRYYEALHENREIFPCFNSFFEYVQFYHQGLKEKDSSKETEYFDFPNFFIVLRQFYEGGSYAYLLNATERMDLVSERMIVFELEKIKEHRLLMSIVTIMIIDTFLSKLFQLPKEVKKVILMEEAWKAMLNPAMANFMLYLNKTIRKYGGESNTATQELEDILGNPFVKNAIVANCATKILFDQSDYKDAFNDVRDLVGLTTKEEALVRSLNQEKVEGRKYREVFIKTGSISRVYAMEVSKEEYAAFTTDPREYPTIYRYQSERGGSLPLALEQFAEELKNP
jgi:conjugation system TraG family ATPase